LRLPASLSDVVVPFPFLDILGESPADFLIVLVDGTTGRRGMGEVAREEQAIGTHGAGSVEVLDEEAAVTVETAGITLDGLITGASKRFDGPDSKPVTVGVMGVFRVILDPTVVTLTAGLVPGFLACRCCLASNSRFSSWVSKAGHVFSSKIRNSFPRSSVVDSKRSNEESVCRRSFAKACQ